MERTLKSNIWKLQAIKALRWFMLIMPIIVLFFQENGLSMCEVFILQSVFSIAIVVSEVPSGYLADIIGRKVSIVAGCILAFAGFGAYSLSYGFWGFLIAELLLGFSGSFISGADSAMIYDTLLEIGSEDEYKKIEGRMLSVGNFSEGVAGLVGGFLALVSLRTPFYFEAAVTFFSIPVAMSLVEPARHKLDNSEGSIKSILKIVKYSLHEHAEIRWLIIYSALVTVSTLTMVWFIQPYLKLVGLPLALFGVVWAALQFSVGIFSFYAHKIELFVGRKATLVSLIVLTVIGYCLLSIFQSIWAIGFILIFYFVRGISYPVLKDYINRIITSDIRATVLSVTSLVRRLIFSIFGPVIGWISDLYSLSTALMLCGIIFLFWGCISLLLLHKHKAL
jgi:MFS family permease